MLIGSITNQGSLQGEMNNANGYLTGVITSAGQLGGQVVGLRGLKGDKGDTGDTGNGIASVTFVSSSGLVDTYKITFTNGTETTFDVTNGEDGIDGVDGHSPVVTASKVGKVTTVSVDGSAIATINDGNDGQDGADGADGYSPSASVSKVGTTATITITDKDGTTTAEIYDGSSGGASAFIAEYGVTTYADVKDAYDEDAIILCTVDDSGNTAICQLAYFDDANDVFYFAQPQSNGFYMASIASGDTWDDGYFTFASTDTATQLRNGLMDALDKQKLDGIASGAEVNVQSDWNQSVNTADDYIKNKPTIPSKTSDLNNDSGFITGMTILSYGSSTWNDFITAYNANKVVYCRASSNANPATGAQTRLAFMAYVNSATPTEVEFQYYRSVSSHSDSQQGDQVFVYKLNSSGTWSVTTREAYSKVVAGTNMSSSYSSGKITLSATDTTYSDFTGTDGDSDGTHGLVPAPQTTDANKYLKADGTWATVSVGNDVVYATSSDSASTVAKTATIVSGTLTTLASGVQAIVKFADTNTASSPTLNIGGTGAKSIKRYGTTAVGQNQNESWVAGSPVLFVYDGTNWVIAGWLNTTYSGGTSSGIITGTDNLNYIWTPKQIHDGIDGMATATPTASKNSKFDSSAHINSTDMTSAEVEDFVDELDVSGINAVDYIVEQGTDGIWTYRKWNSGISECWGTYSCASKTYSAHAGNGFNPTLPSNLFVVKDKMSVFASGRIAGVSASGVGYTDINSVTQLQVWLVNFTASSQSSKTGEIYVHVKGTWK